MVCDVARLMRNVPAGMLMTAARRLTMLRDVDDAVV